MAAPPSGYSPDASLLPVGSGPITAMQGGGIVGGAIPTPMTLLKQIRDELQSSLAAVAARGENVSENAAYAKMLLIAAPFVLEKVGKPNPRNVDRQVRELIDYRKRMAITASLNAEPPILDEEAVRKEILAKDERTPIENYIQSVKPEIEGIPISTEDIANAKRRFGEKTGVGLVMKEILSRARRAINAAFPDEPLPAAKIAESTPPVSPFSFGSLSKDVKARLAESVKGANAQPLSDETVIQRLIEKGIGLFLGTERSTVGGDIHVEVYVDKATEISSETVTHEEEPVRTENNDKDNSVPELDAIPNNNGNSATQGGETERVVEERVTEMSGTPSLTNRQKKVEEAKRRLRTAAAPSTYERIRREYDLNSTVLLENIPAILGEKLDAETDDRKKRKIKADLKLITTIIKEQNIHGNIPIKGGSRRTRRLRKTLPS
jgi:hypothetical protein